MRKLLLITMCFAIALMFSGVAYGMHDEGVARCGTCHTMHNSQNNVPVDAGHVNGNSYLLIKATASDVCLSCHGTGREMVFGTDPMIPPTLLGAGNFVFLLEDRLNERGDLANGNRAGHNLNAPSRSVYADGTILTAPGGDYPSEAMGCSSCHDPHGNTNFRLLYGQQYVEAGNVTFTNPAPIAEAISRRSAGESNSLHNAYKSGMSAWCGNCHGNFHQQVDGSRLVHKSGVLLSSKVIGIYNRYNGTAQWNSGSAATAYLAAVPFEDPAMDTLWTAGPTASSQISCITCHRAHGSSAPSAGRWDFGLTFQGDDGIASGSYAIPNPYPDLVPETQRSLCNKCHAKDAYDLGSAP